jgi:phage FluMu protein Com
VKVDVILKMVITHKRIELPVTCPKCNADFTINGLRLWEYQDQQRPGHINAAGLVVDDMDHSPEGGENFLGYVSIWCPKCDNCLFDTKMQEETVT